MREIFCCLQSRLWALTFRHRHADDVMLTSRLCAASVQDFARNPQEFPAGGSAQRYPPKGEEIRPRPSHVLWARLPHLPCLLLLLILISKGLHVYRHFKQLWLSATVSDSCSPTLLYYRHDILPATKARGLAHTRTKNFFSIADTRAF